MTDRYLTMVLEEAEHVAEQHDQVARAADNQAHEYLRYAVLRVLEGQADHLPTDWTSIDGVTVGYGSDEAMCDSWGSSEGPEGHSVEDLLHERLSGPAEAVATDGGRTGDVRDRLVVDDDPQSQDDLELRTQRAVNEAMDVSLLSKGGRYEVQSESGRWYEVDVISESCTCPDWQQRTPEGGCKHMRRVDHEIKRGRVPRPDGRLPSE